MSPIVNQNISLLAETKLLIRLSMRKKKEGGVFTDVIFLPRTFEGDSFYQKPGLFVKQKVLRKSISETFAGKVSGQQKLLERKLEMKREKY